MVRIGIRIIRIVTRMVRIITRMVTRLDRKWNHPNRKLNYFSNFHASDQKTPFTKCFTFDTRVSKSILNPNQAGGGQICPTKEIGYIGYIFVF